MEKTLSGMWAAIFAATLSVATIAPVDAAPFFLPKAPVTQQSDIVQVRDNWGRHYGGNNWRRGYRGHHRYDDGLWISGGAFIAGALIGSAIANSNYYGDNYYGDRYGRRYYRDDPRDYPEGYRYYPDTGHEVVCPSRAEDLGKC